MFVPKFTDDSRADYLGLDHSQQIQVNKSLQRVEQVGMQAGQPCAASWPIVAGSSTNAWV